MASDRIQRRIDRLLDQAEEAMDQLNWDAVRQYAQAVLSLDSGNTDGLAYLDSADQVQPNPPNPGTPLGPTSPTPGQADQPTSFANGRYQVKRFLGEGGKKKVYLAQDTLLDSEVAFALIKTEGLDEVPRTRITREAQAMGRLGSHPHIVTVFDLGQENDQPYMVTELMGRGDVEGLIEDAPDHRLPLEQTIDIAKETCSGLKFAHSRGIVHRDLKPGNIWLTSDGRLSWADLRFGNRAPGQCRPNRRSEMEIENKLKAMGLELPSVTPPPPGRAGAVKVGNILFVGRHTPGQEYRGKLGADITVERAHDGARQACLNCLADVKAVIGDLDRVKRVAKLLCMINSAPDFGQQPQVANGATDLLSELYGEAGVHARSAVGLAALPNGACIEIEMIMEVED